MVDADHSFNILMMASSSGVGLTYHLTRLSIALKKKGHNVTVISGVKEQAEGLSAELEKNGIEHFASKHIDRMDFVSIYNCKRDLQKILKNSNIEVIHANGVTHAFPAYLAIRSLPRDKKPAIVTSLHSIPNESLLQKPKWKTMISILNRSSNIILPVSNDMKERLIKHGLNPKKTLTVHNAIDLEVFDELSKNAQIDLNIEDAEKPTVMYVANLTPIKGQEYYLMAAAKVLKECRASFYVVGEGPRKEHLEHLAHNLGIQNNVVFTGRIHWPQIYYVLSNIADICVSSSLSENFPFYILECMAARKPIVATNVGGVPEAIIDGVNGYLIPPKDPMALARGILNLIKNPDKAREMGLRGRKMVEERFSMNILTQKLEQVYKLSLKANVKNNG